MGTVKNTTKNVAKGKVVVAMSGGVDSTVTAWLLLQQGYEVVGLFMQTGVEVANAGDARVMADRLGIELFELDFREPFDGIIDYFVDEYCRGRTPNPCVRCNRLLKFGKLAEFGESIGADFLATGHYARVEQCDSGQHGSKYGGEYRLMRAVDLAKDQSYVLFGIGREKLSRILFPLGSMTKLEVREQARQLGLSVSGKPDSQDACFVPDRDYVRIVRERRPEVFKPGPVFDSSGREVGQHEGVGAYTIGQRRGLGIAMGYPIYVTRINAAANSIVVGPREELASSSLTASDVRWLIDLPKRDLYVSAKIRYAHTPATAVVELLGDDRVAVRFDEPQFAVTPGQAVVFYDSDVVLGGGCID